MKDLGRLLQEKLNLQKELNEAYDNFNFEIIHSIRKKLKDVNNLIEADNSITEYDKELKEINIEIKGQEELISKLRTQLNELKRRKTQLIQANCEHIYETSNYCICSLEGKPKTQLKCKKCGKIAYTNGLCVYEVKE